MKQWMFVLHVVLAASSTGCLSTPNHVEPSVVEIAKSIPEPVVRAAAQETNANTDEKAVGSPVARPAYAQLETLPIDLSTVIRLVDAKSPAIGFAQARVRESQARLAAANVQWLPNLSFGTVYNRFDGQTQNQVGLVFGRSRANLFAGGGPAMTLDLADALYRPLAERRQVASSRFREQAVLIGSELDAVNAYFDLVQAHAQLEINADTLKKAEDMHRAAKNAHDAKLDRAAGDVNRAMTEVLFRRTERFDLEGKIGVASARLGRLLLLPPNVKLVPADVAVAPVTLVDPNETLDQLLATSLANRPDLAANRESIAAAWARVRRQERGPRLPKVVISNQTGTFGGGLNDDLSKFQARNVLSAQIYWEVRNLGFGNRAAVSENRALMDQAQYQLVESQARAAAEVVESAHIAGTKFESLQLAENAIKEAAELYRISKEGTTNVVDTKNLFDALRPLQAIQIHNQARHAYLAAVLDYSRSQYRLYAALGHPPGVAGRK